MTNKEKPGKEEISNPSLYAGLKFYDVLMKKQNLSSMLAHTGDLALWRGALEDYYTSTGRFMSPPKMKEIGAKLVELDSRISNYLTYRDRLANAKTHYMKLRRELFDLHKAIMDNTAHLDLKTSQGDNGSFDVKRLFTT